jgi:hypothetical protein
MAMLMGQSCGALVVQVLPCCFAGVSLSSYRRVAFLRSASLGQGAVLDRRVFHFHKMFYSLSFA